MGGCFLQKELPKNFSWGRFLGKIYGEGYMEGLMIRSYEGRGSKMHFPIICISINCKSFPQPCWHIHLMIKLWPKLRKDLILELTLNMFISLYVNPELEHWYIIRKVKGYPCYKTITSVSSEAQVKNIFISHRNYLLFKIFKFYHI